MVEEEVKRLNFVKWFSKIDKNLIDLVGEKGVGLGELFNRNFPVPEGFVVTTESYLAFLESANLKDQIEKIFSGTNFKNKEEVSRNCDKAKELLLKAELPENIKEEIFESYENLGADKLEIEKGSALDILNNVTEPIFVSVRSSLPFNFSDLVVREQNTYLNVKGNDSLLDHIKNCFISLFNPETLMREFSLEFDSKKLKIAVIVQKMVPAEKSGIVLSRDSSGDRSIYAIWGLGEGINLKEVSPDKYILSKELDLLDKKIGEKSFMVVRDSSGNLKSVKSSEERKKSQVLNSYEIQRLGDLAEKVEIHFGTPQKLEFSIDESGIYILQTREIKNSEKNEIPKFEELKSSSIRKELKQTKEILVVDKVTKTKLKLVLDSPYIASDASLSGLKKVGILKLEKLIEDSGKHPFYFLDSHYLNEYENLIFEGIKKLEDLFEEVWVRTSDFTSDQFFTLEGSRREKENNPFLGLHGIRFGLKYPDLLEAELRALKRFSEKVKVGVLIPNLVSIEELNKVREILKKINFEKVLIGVLIETPAAVQLIKEICASEVDAIVINTDRLMQYLLASDESNPQVIGILQEVHPAFSYQLEYMVRVSKRNNIDTNVFGELASNKDILEHLVKRGIDFISVKPEDAKEISEKILKIETEFLTGTDAEPRKYEVEKSKENYLKENPSEDKIKSIFEKSPKADKKLKRDLELIEAEKKEFLSESDENLNSSEETLHEELKESPDEEFDHEAENVEWESEDIKKKDVLGIF
ncbi:hypothetical protein COT60_00875 [Candidatus Pacearchaeota archaeon CG09_land_8_20_14_0_10_30_9]|nr:MAG: hypothetical protein COT60_00875 [Candidatus Pacearchaeota archaeon CG09_land_8_20_14_0_10_30_9]